MKQCVILITFGMIVVLGWISGPSTYGQCGAPWICEVGIPDMGSSYAGATARAQDASTAYTNPSGIVLLQKDEVLFGFFGSYVDSAFPVNTDKTTKDTWRTGLGFQYRPRSRWLLRSGVSFNSSPISDDRRLPDLPVDDTWRFSLGIEHKLSDHLMIGISYTFAYLGEGGVDRVQLPLQQLGPVVLDGDYSPNNAHFLGLTLRWH